MTVKNSQLLHLKSEAPQAPSEGPSEQKVEEGPSRETPSPQGQKRRHRTSPHRHRKRPSLESTQTVSPCQPGPSPASSAPNPPSRSPSLDDLAPTMPANDMDNSAYNSEDEYDRNDESNCLSERDMLERERRFEVTLRQKGFIVKKMDEDGACLFRAVADQIYGDQTMHDLIRQHCMDYIMKNGDYFSQYVTEPFDRYVERKRRANAHGNHIEMQALSEMFNRPIEVYHYSEEPINIFHGMHNSGLDPIRLSYHRGVHYNSIVDPFKATIGVGLGLPGFQPGVADKNLVMEAIRASEQTELERRMLKDKLLASDYEATNEALEKQVAHESYLEYLRENERRYKKQKGPSGSKDFDCARDSSSPRSGRASPKVGCSSQMTSQGSKSPRHSPRLATVKEGGRMSPLPCTSNQRDSPKPSSSQQTTQIGKKAFFDDFPPELFGLEDYDDGVLARVLAESQEEYLRQFKKQKEQQSSEASASSSADWNQGASTSKDHSMH